MNSKAQWREWARNLDEREVQRITRQLAAAVERARAMRAGTEPTSGRLEPTGIYVPEDVAHIVCKKRRKR